MALRRALEILIAGEQANERLHRLAVHEHPQPVRHRWTDGGTRRRIVTGQLTLPRWSMTLASAPHEAT